MNVAPKRALSLLVVLFWKLVRCSLMKGYLSVAPKRGSFSVVLLRCKLGIGLSKSCLRVAMKRALWA